MATENTARYNNGMGCQSQRSPWSTCGSSSVADGLEDLGDEFIYPASLYRQNFSEIQAGTSNESDEDTEKLRVCLIGHIGVGKTSLCNQFKTSNYVNTFEASLGMHLLAMNTFGTIRFNSNYNQTSRTFAKTTLISL